MLAKPGELGDWYIRNQVDISLAPGLLKGTLSIRVVDKLSELRQECG